MIIKHCMHALLTRSAPIPKLLEGNTIVVERDEVH
jgi:hypothetical protein